MTATLGDILLVFLADRPATAWELQQRHAQTFGRQGPFDVTRVATTLPRLERQGHVRCVTTTRTTGRRISTVTDAGPHRKCPRTLQVPADTTDPEAADRVPMAPTADDRATIEAVAAACVTALTARQRRDSRRRHAVVSARHACKSSRMR